MTIIKHTLEKTGFVPVSGGAIHYRLYEPHVLESSQKAPLFVVHGGPGASHALLYNYLGSLADDRPVVFYDQLGSFFSPAEINDDHMVMDRFSEEIYLLMRALDYKKIVLLGHSWGGAIATDYAIRHPDKLTALILSSPLLSTQKWVDDCSALISKMPVNIQKILAQGGGAHVALEEAYKNAEKIFMDIHFCRTANTSTALTKHRSKFNRDIYHRMWGDSEFRCTGSLQGLDFFHNLGTIHIPSLIICGEFDMATPQTMSAAKDLMGSAKLKVVPKSGHLAFIDGNDVYLSALREFLSGI